MSERAASRRGVQALAALLLVFLAAAANAQPVVTRNSERFAPCSASLTAPCTPTSGPPSPTPTPTPSPTSAPTSTPTSAPSATPTPSLPPTASPTASRTPTRTTTQSTNTPTQTTTPPTPTATSSSTPSVTPTPTIRPPSPSPTPTRYYTNTYTYTPTYTPYTSTPTPSRTYTPTLTPTPTKSILVYKVGGYPAISAMRTDSDGIVPGGLGRFGVKVSGYGDKWITLQIVRTEGRNGSAVFADTRSQLMLVPGECDIEFLVQGWLTSDLPRNLEIQAVRPVPEVGVASSTPFTVFRMVFGGQFSGPIPLDASGSGNPLYQYLQENRLDHRNELGFSETPDRTASRGNVLLKFRVEPMGMDPDDFRRGGPFLGFGPTQGFDEQRTWTSRFYADGCLYVNSGNRQDSPESSAAILKDVSADSDGMGRLYICDYDAPSLNKFFPRAKPGDGLNHYARVRGNFFEWATYTDDEGNSLRVSGFFPWFWRGSWHLRPDGVIVAEGANRDNEVGVGATPLTYDLTPDIDPNLRIDDFSPKSGSSLSPFVTITIFGDFPQGNSECNDWQVELVAPGDPPGDPEKPETEEILITPAFEVGRKRDGSAIRATFNLRPDGIPFAAKDYQVRVLHGAKSVEMGTFTITESAFDHWKWADRLSQSGDRIRVFVMAVDARGNIVTRPNAPAPRIERVGGIETTLFSVYGNDGQYYGEANRVNPGEQGTLTVQASGSGAPLVEATYTIGP